MLPTTSLSYRKSVASTVQLRPPKVITKENVIRLTVRDVPRIIALNNKITQHLYGNCDVYDIVYNSFITLGLESNGELIGSVCFNHYPNIKSIPKWSWFDWIKNLFDINFLNTINSKWMELIMFNVKYTETFLKPILKVLFKEFKRVEYVAIPIPPGILTPTFLTEYITRIMSDFSASPKKSTSIGLLARKDFCKPYKVRKAVNEDNDDVIDIFNSYTPVIKEAYGEFYIAEMLRIGGYREVIVAEYKRRVVAALVVNSIVNYDILFESFDINPFNGFKTAHDEDDFLKIKTISDHEVSISSFEEEIILQSPTLSITSSDKLSMQFEDETERSSSESSEESWTFDPSIDLSTLVMRYNDECFDLSAFYKMDSQTSILSTCLLNEPISPDVQSRLARRPSNEVIEQQQKRKRSIPKYYGDPDAFTLELIGSRPEHELAINDLIKTSFECYDRNYFLMTAPTMDPPLSYFRDFVRVTPKNYTTFPHDLFVLHRHGVNPKLHVRPTIDTDIGEVSDFLSRLLKPSDIFRRFTESLQEDSDITTFIMSCNEQIIAIAVVNGGVDLEYLYSHYTLYEWINESKHNRVDTGILEYFLIYPVFHRYCIHFLNEIHRLGDYSMLVYYLIQTDLDYLLRSRPLLNCIEYLVPVTPRIMPAYDPHFIEKSCYPSKNITEEKEPFSLFISTVRLLGIKRIEIGAKIVVVGTGDTAMSFLETLISGSQPDLLVTFNNITVVSPHGLPFRTEGLSQEFFLLVNPINKTWYNRILQMNIHVHVNIVQGVMNKIKRDKKLIIINEINQLEYDYLVLVCGEQYKMPKLKSKEKKRFSEFPKNTFMLNTEYDVYNVYVKLKKYQKHFTDEKFMGNSYVIVYGKDVNALACLGALLDLGIPPEYLVIVEPEDSSLYQYEDNEYSNIAFYDPEIEQAVNRTLEKLGITVYKKYKLTDWQLNEENKVNTIEIRSRYRVHHIGCKFLFIYAEKYISDKTCSAILKSGLVFDGRLIIDENFQTNDRYIYAAGSLTKYSRKYYSNHKNHVYFNPHEVGEKLAIYFRNMLIPDKYKEYQRIEIKEDLPSTIIDKKINFEEILPNFEKPIITHYLFPGGLYYLNVLAPGKRPPLEVNMTSEDYGHLLITGDYDFLDDQGYFRLHINKMDVVENFCCLNKEPIDVTNLIRIWGKHSTILNDILIRFESSSINDFFEFFKEPYFTAIFYDKFPSLMTDIRQLLINTGVKNGKTIADIALDVCQKNDWAFLSDIQNYKMNKLLRESELMNDIEIEVLKYIKENKMHLPMYAYPSLIEKMVQNCKNSPLFTE